MRSDFENFGAFINTDLAPPKNSSGANDVITTDHVLQPRLEFVIDTSLKHRVPTQSVWVADCYFIVNVLDLPFASPTAIYR